MLIHTSKIYQIFALGVGCSMAFVIGGQQLVLLPAMLLLTAFCWAEAVASHGDAEAAKPTWTGILKRLFGPTVLPIYLFLSAALVFANNSRINRKTESGCGGAMACGVCGAVGAPVPASVGPTAQPTAATPSMCGGSKGGCGASGGGACGCGSKAQGAGGKEQGGKGTACGCGSSTSKTDGAGAGSPSAPDRLEGRPPKDGEPATAQPQATAAPAKPVPVPPVLKGRTMQPLPARSLPGISPTARPLPPSLKPNPNAPMPPGVKPLPSTDPVAPPAGQDGSNNEESRKVGKGS